MKGSTSERQPSMEVPEELVVQAQGGNPDAIAELYDTVRPVVARTVARLAWSDPGSVSELTHDALQHVVLGGLNPSRFRGGNFAAWATTTAHNKTLNTIDTRKVRERRELSGLDTDKVAIPPGSPDTETEAVESEAMNRITAVLDAARITRRLRGPFIMHHIHGIPTAEIATELGIPKNTVLTRIHRVKRALQAYYGVTEGSTMPWDICEDPHYRPAQPLGAIA